MSDLNFLLFMSFCLFVPLLMTSFSSMICEKSNFFNIFLEGIMILGAFFGCLMMRLLREEVSPLFLFAIIFIGLLIISLFLSFLLKWILFKIEINATLFGIIFNLLMVSLCHIISNQIFGGNSFYFSQIFSFRLLIYFGIILLIIFGFFLWYKKYFVIMNIFSEQENIFKESGYPMKKLKSLNLWISTLISLISGFILIALTSTSFDSSVYNFGFIALFIVLISRKKLLRVILMTFLFCFLKVCVQTYFNYSLFKELFLLIPYILILVVLIFQNKFRQIE